MTKRPTPTGVGKSRVAMALAPRVGGEIVNFDSVQVYRGFDIGSGKPTAEELARAPHHVISVLDPMELVDAADLLERAVAVERSASRNCCRKKTG